jgi:23S rRNA G2445 N2-methylase RlmL
LRFTAHGRYTSRLRAGGPRVEFRPHGARASVAGREIFFASCAPGIEPVLHEEARALRLAKVERQVGGVRFEGTMRDAWRANLYLRTAIRVLLRVARFEARDTDALYAGVSRVDWSRFLRTDGTFVVDARTKESALDHTLFVEQRVKDAVVDQFRSRSGRRPAVDKESPDLGISVHLFRDRCTVMVDTSGESLHKRGWRRFQGRAPLAETLAAAIVMLSGWDRRSPLLDPFCGSGTILIEGALLAGGARVRALSGARRAGMEGPRRRGAA